MSPGSMLSEAFRFSGTPGTSRPHRHLLWHMFCSPLLSSRTLLPFPNTSDPLMLCRSLSLPESVEYADSHGFHSADPDSVSAVGITYHYQIIWHSASCAITTFMPPNSPAMYMLHIFLSCASGSRDNLCQVHTPICSAIESASFLSIYR